MVQPDLKAMGEPLSEFAVESVVHTHADNLLSSLLSGGEGIFQRYTVKEEEGAGRAGESSIVVLWTVKLKHDRKIVEWLLRMSVVKDDSNDGYTVTMNSIEVEDELPKEALDKLASLRRSERSLWRNCGVVEGKMTHCVLIIRSMKYGQSSFSLRGAVCATESLKEEGNKNLFESMPATGLGVREKLNLISVPSNTVVLRAIEQINCNLFKQYEDSVRVDEDRYRSTMDEIDLEVAGLLSDHHPQEKAMMEEAKKILDHNEEGWKCISHEGANPIRISKLCREGHSVPWGKAEATIHASAKRLLAYLLNFDSIERIEYHNDKYGNLPKCMHVGGEGGIADSRHFFYCVKVPNTRRTRRFEVRAAWEMEVNSEERNKKVYRFAWCPANELNEKEDDISRMKKECGFKDGNSFLAKTRGIYELREAAENVTELTMIRNDNIRGNVSAKVKESSLINTIRVTVLNLQKKYERNWRSTDEEVMGALVETMRTSGEDLKLTTEQEEIFRELDKLTEGGKGWRTLRSPTPDLRMWIKYNQQVKGERSIATGRAEGIVDCAADEAAALFFHLCSNERMRIRYEEGDLAQLEVKGKNKRLVNERTFATVRKTPFPLTNREFVFKYVWRVSKAKSCVSVGIWPTDDVVDYGRSVGKTIRGTVKGLFTATNICGVGSGVNQCKVTYYMVS